MGADGSTSAGTSDVEIERSRKAQPSPASQARTGVHEQGAGQDGGMLRRIAPQPDDVDLREGAERDGEQEAAAVANPRRIRR